MLSVLCNVELNEKNDSFSQNTKSYNRLVQNQHLENLNENPIFFDFIDNLTQVVKQPNLNDTTKLNQTIDFIKSQINESNLNELVSLAISAMQLFVQINWLGPNTATFVNIPNQLIDENELKNNLSFKIFNLLEYFKLNSEVIFIFFALTSHF
jgi:hypothetical protein